MLRMEKSAHTETQASLLIIYYDLIFIASISKGAIFVSGGFICRMYSLEPYADYFT